jgi:hypothetical protein
MIDGIYVNMADINFKAISDPISTVPGAAEDESNRRGAETQRNNIKRFELIADESRSPRPLRVSAPLRLFLLRVAA